MDQSSARQIIASVEVATHRNYQANVHGNQQSPFGGNDRRLNGILFSTLYSMSIESQQAVVEAFADIIRKVEGV